MAETRFHIKETMTYKEGGPIFPTWPWPRTQISFRILLRTWNAWLWHHQFYLLLTTVSHDCIWFNLCALSSHQPSFKQYHPRTDSPVKTAIRTKCELTKAKGWLVIEQLNSPNYMQLTYYDLNSQNTTEALWSILYVATRALIIVFSHLYLGCNCLKLMQVYFE